MGLQDLNSVKVGSLVGSAMETAGTALQSDFLNFVNGDQGQLIAGLLYLIAVSGGVLTVAIGGSFKWARYLLIGPPLFFFLTQVRVSSNGADWAFGNDTFPKDARERALRGVNKFDEGDQGTNSVALAFYVWNVITSDVTHTLVDQLKRDRDDRHLNFVNKVDRFMNQWNYASIQDQDIRLLIHTVMTPKCSQYFKFKTIVASEHEPQGAKDEAIQALTDLEKKPVGTFMKGMNESIDDMLEKGIIQEGGMTCNDLWVGVVTHLREVFQSNIKIEVQRGAEDAKDPKSQLKLFLQKFTTSTDRGTGEVTMEEVVASDDFDDKLKEAADWILARALWVEVWADNPFLNTFEFELKPVIESGGGGLETGNSDTVHNVDGEMMQFNTADKYQQRGTYVNAAMSLPYFQGVMLFLLSASYPFFALMVVIPGRATAMLSWFGLWAWVKLWDLGFAVVMMIDDILYAMFPKAPSFDVGAENEAIMDPGASWSRILEMDPNYSAMMYYNLIATCLFAVPVATAFFIKGGASELTNLMHGSWQTQANRLGSSAGSYARALQSQGYAKKLSEESQAAGMSAWARAQSSKEMADINAKYDAATMQLRALDSGVTTKTALAFERGMVALGLETKALSSLTKRGAPELKKYLEERQKQLRAAKYSLSRFAAKKAQYEYVHSARGFWLSERAVAARYSNHHFNVPHYGKYQMEFEYRRELSKEERQEYTNRHKEITEELKDFKGTDEQRTDLERERDKLEFTANSNFGGSGNDIQVFDFNSMASSYADSIGKTALTFGISSGGPD